MTKAFEKISAGLAEARAFAQGKKVKGLRLHTREIANRDVAAVRLKAGLTQEQFAESMALKGRALSSSVLRVFTKRSALALAKGFPCRDLMVGQALEQTPDFACAAKP
jgi:hypothetical protein